MMVKASPPEQDFLTMLFRRGTRRQKKITQHYSNIVNILLLVAIDIIF